MKKIVSLILASILLIMPMCIETYASDDVNYDNLIMPCYDYISSISAGITEGTLGFATCASICTNLTANVTIVLTCTLQRCKASTPWEVYKSETETFTGKGAFSIEKKWFTPATYDAYRVVTTVVVKNSAGTTVETATRSSGVLYK